MKCCRVFIFVLLMLCTACATCSILFPQFRKIVDRATMRTSTVYLWYRESSMPIQEAQSVSINRTYSYHLPCPRGQLFNTVSAALSVAATALISSSMLFAACWIDARYNNGLAVAGAFMAFLSFAGFGAVLSWLVYTYLTTLCPGEAVQILGAKEDGYALAEGFYLLCAATGGALLCFVISFALCCSAVCCSSEVKNNGPYE
ncbi:hypothetical protein LSCM4_05583 [Leishmania orientalis]|uniref:Amastin-like protein n=1 Tax=Leishmania orientalis TaxID=2249476 RepID=A0A836KTM2_9TRYP|nr:hypothetical protein LSCM4_05583 [Leishmania orientalis]